MKRLAAIMMVFAVTAAALAGCGSSQQSSGSAGAGAATQTEAQAETEGEAAAAEQDSSGPDQSGSSAESLADGFYTADFNTDSSMFHVNDAYDGRGILVVDKGLMVIHVALPSKNIVNLYYGTAEEAQREGAALLRPVSETVIYSDGITEEVNSFNIPVPYFDKEYDVALIGKKGKWYDHKVSVSNPRPLGEADRTEAVEKAIEDMTGNTAADDSEGDASKGETSVSEADQKAADAVAKKIDAIYVQEWTKETDGMCLDARKAWDALTDEQKQLVEGEYADPDYFGRDTGDAADDAPLNGDMIREKELLVVSFGTSFNDSRTKDIGGIEAALQLAYTDWSVRRAFTSQIIINHVRARDGEIIDNVEQGLQRAMWNGVTQLVIQPTHLMHGAEYDELMEMVEKYRSKFKSLEIAEPLLGEVGADASVINADKESVAKAVTEAAVGEAGYESLEAAEKDGTAFVFMGHGTSHTAKVSYSQMQTQMEELGYKNVFIGTVEGEPEETSCEAVIEKVKAAGYTNVVLRPLMVVAGDHANNDMAGEDEDSWVSMFKASGYFKKIDTQIAGLGSIPAIQQIYVEHAGEAMK